MMEASRNSWITTVLFEHACKQDFSGVVNHIFEDKDLISKIQDNSTPSESNQPDQTKIKPVFMLIYLLKKLYDGNFAKNWSDKKPCLVIELLESTFKQHNCISLKKFLTLISELKLLDLLNLIVVNSESSHVVHKLNQHFPRWTHDCRSSMEKDFCITNPKVLDKVEESHTQCRRLILKLAVDKVFKSKYMSEQYLNDINRLIKESKTYIKEIISALELHAGPSVLEKMANGENGCQDSDDLAVQLLLDYIQPTITDEVLLRYLDDLELTLNSQPTSCFTTCLLPFDTMSEMSEDSDQRQSDYEDYQDDNSLKSFGDILPSESPIKSKDVPMNVDAV